MRALIFLRFVKRSVEDGVQLVVNRWIKDVSASVWSTRIEYW